VRKAFYQAIDIEAIHRVVMRKASKPTGLMIAEGINGFQPDMNTRFPYDPAAARKLLADAGYAQGFSVTFDCPNDRYVNDEAICLAVVPMLKRIGIDAKLNAQTKSLHFEKIGRTQQWNTSFYMLGWTPGSLDAHNPLLQLMTLDGEGQGTWNSGRYTNPRVEELTDLIGSEIDADKRNSMIREAFKIHQDDVGHIPLHQQALAWGIGDKVKEVKQRPNNDVDLRYVMRPGFFGIRAASLSSVTHAGLYRSPTAAIHPGDACRRFHRLLPVQFRRRSDQQHGRRRGDGGGAGVGAQGTWARRLPATLELVFVAAVLALVIGVPLGVYTGLHRDGAISRILLTASLVGISLPTFLIGILLILIFSVWLGWLPSFGRGATVDLWGWESNLVSWEGFKSIILPSVTLCLFQLTLLMRLVRAEMLEVLRTDYIKFARARGLTNRAVNFGHALKNTLVPVITITGLQIGSLIAFAIITETVFQWPGMGLLFLQAIQFVDIPVMAAYLCLVAFIFVVINLIVDLLYYAIDPRLRLEGTGHAH
jgi:ABC-type dipeptide/oligopeptide/nickel transport system permease component